MRGSFKWGRDSEIVATIKLDRDALAWLIDYLPDYDDATKQLKKYYFELLTQEETNV